MLMELVHQGVYGVSGKSFPMFRVSHDRNAARVFGFSEVRTFLHPTLTLHLISCMGVNVSVMEPVYVFHLPKVS